ncbi:thioredoxin family protein [Tenacibaculum sp. IB213877]|uniref:thioredoxin family protein n=1 Tax=Tenacibaculum sp. IB213877 TaxID=3097351 RepID=UPI002A5A35CF|nr:thioredoxin family protein [Tenacibaculum sp. IB213877]MDY0779972.1 thioredoxin family protein [Tenacibaculum sp. IB213877]
MFFLLNACIVLSQGIEFKEVSVDKAIELAKKENKYVFVDVYTNWCRPCKLMDKQVFTQKKVGDYFNSKFINIKINAEYGEEGPKFANNYKINSYPTFVILDSNGSLVHLFAGGILDGEEFIGKVKESYNPQKAFGVLQKKYNSGIRDRETVSAYLQALIKTNTIRVDKLVDEFYTSLNKEERISDETLFVFEKFAPLGSDKSTFFEANIANFRRKVGNEKVDAILVSNYELYFGLLVKSPKITTSIEEINKKANQVESLGIKNLKAIPAFKAAALLKLENIKKEEFFKELDRTNKNLTNREKDLMLFIIIPGLKNILTETEKQKLLKLVTDEGVKGYIIRASN